MCVCIYIYCGFSNTAKPDFSLGKRLKERNQKKNKKNLENGIFLKLISQAHPRLLCNNGNNIYAGLMSEVTLYSTWLSFALEIV